MNSYTLTHSISCYRVNTLTFSRLIIKIIGVFGILVSLSLIIFYIYQSNQFVSEGYLVKSSQDEIKELKEENRISESNFYQANSLENLEEKIKSLNFVEIDKINYIQILGTQVAAKEKNW